jgi:hypothetical protein
VSAAVHLPLLYGGRVLPARDVLALQLVEAVTRFRVTLPEDKDGQQAVMPVLPDEWVTLVKFLYNQIDGPPQPSTGAALLALELDAMLAEVMGDAGDDGPDAAPTRALPPPDGV